MPAALKAAGNIVGRNVVPTQFDAQRNALCGQLLAGQCHVIDMHLVALCFAPGHKQRKGAAGERGFKCKADFGGSQGAQALQHDAPGFKRHGFGGVGREARGNLVGVYNSRMPRASLSK